jgi:hypothetical protein
MAYDANRTQIFTDKRRFLFNLKYGLFDLCASVFIRVLFKNSKLTIFTDFVINFHFFSPVYADQAAESE